MLILIGLLMSKDLKEEMVFLCYPSYKYQENRL